MGGFAPIGGVVFGPDEVVSAFFRDDPEGVLLIVKWVNRDDFVGKDDFFAAQKRARFTDFAVFFFAGGGSHRDGATVLLATERDDHSTFAIADGFAVQGEALGQAALILLKPAGDCFGVGIGVDLVHEVVEGVVARHFEPPAAVFFSHS